MQHKSRRTKPSESRDPDEKGGLSGTELTATRNVLFNIPALHLFCGLPRAIEEQHPKRDRAEGAQDAISIPFDQDGERSSNQPEDDGENAFAGFSRPEVVDRPPKGDSSSEPNRSNSLTTSWFARRACGHFTLTHRRHEKDFKEGETRGSCGTKP